MMVLRQKVQNPDDSEAKEFVDSASALAQRPIESLWGRIGRKPRTSKGMAATRTRRPQNNRGQMPKMDATTAFAIVTELSKVDLSVRDNVFYDATDAETSEKEDVGKALAILRSWMRKKGLKPMDVFQAWDGSGNFHLSRRELGVGLENYGLKLNEELVTLIFDHMTDRYKLDYDDFKEWYDTTKHHELTHQERMEKAATAIQNMIRGRAARREVQQRKETMARHGQGAEPAPARELSAA